MTAAIECPGKYLPARYNLTNNAFNTSIVSEMLFVALCKTTHSLKLASNQPQTNASRLMSILSLSMVVKLFKIIQRAMGRKINLMIKVKK